MATETRYIVRSADDSHGRACRTIDAARWLAQDWRREGRRGVTVDEMTITTRRIYTV